MSEGLPHTITQPQEQQHQQQQQHNQQHHQQHDQQQHRRRPNLDTANPAHKQPTHPHHKLANNKATNKQQQQNNNNNEIGNTFAGYSIVEHSNLLRNAAIQSKNMPYTYYSSYYTIVPQDVINNNNQGNNINSPHHRLATIHTPSLNEYLDQSIDDMFYEAINAVD